MCLLSATRLKHRFVPLNHEQQSRAFSRISLQLNAMLLSTSGFPIHFGKSPLFIYTLGKRQLDLLSLAPVSHLGPSGIGRSPLKDANVRIARSEKFQSQHAEKTSHQNETCSESGHARK
jgi:hypothetical protein